MKSKAEQQETPSNTFLRTLAELRRGQEASALSDALADVVGQVLKTGKSGSLTLKLTVRPNADGETLSLKADHTVKLPKPEAKETNFFADDNNVLMRDNPKQKELFKTVEGGAQEEKPQAEAVNS